MPMFWILRFTPLEYQDKDDYLFMINQASVRNQSYGNTAFSNNILQELTFFI